MAYLAWKGCKVAAWDHDKKPCACSINDAPTSNCHQVLERDQKISELDRRADDLQEGASQFQQQAVKLKRKYWWENVKMWIVIAVVLFIIVIVVVVTTQTNQGQLAKVNADDSSPEIAPGGSDIVTSPEPTASAAAVTGGKTPAAGGGLSVKGVKS